MQDMEGKLIEYIDTFNLLMTDDLRSSFRLMQSKLDDSSRDYIIDAFADVVRKEQLRFFKQGLLKGFNTAYFFSSMEDMEQDNNNIVVRTQSNCNMDVKAQDNDNVDIKAYKNVISFMDYKKDKSSRRKTKRKKQVENFEK